MFLLEIVTFEVPELLVETAPQMWGSGCSLHVFSTREYAPDAAGDTPHTRDMQQFCDGEGSLFRGGVSEVTCWLTVKVRIGSSVMCHWLIRTDKTVSFSRCASPSPGVTWVYPSVWKE